MAFQRLPAIELERRQRAANPSIPDDQPGDLCAEGWGEMPPEQQIALCLRWLEACLVRWSYAADVTPENRALLDYPTLLWAWLESVQHNHRAALEAKEPGSSPSIATSTASQGLDAPTGGG